MQIDRAHCAPWGLAGGLEGKGNQVALRLDGREIEDLPNAKVLTQRLKPGDAFVLRSGGGGGFGSPTERDPDHVAADVAEGYVSREVAREAYGVIVTEEGGLDRAATQRLRQQIVLEQGFAAALGRRAPAATE
jgi:N-methylhydantoinase B